MSKRLVIVSLIVAAGCAGPSAEKRLAAARPGVQALQEGRFTEAAEQARNVLAKDGGNPSARAVQALTRYKISGEQAIFDGAGLAESVFRGRVAELARLRQVIVDFEAVLGRIDDDLKVAAMDPSFSMELCLACWKIDWNHNGRLDRRDERLMQIEQDEQGNEFPEEDPRRTPTFRFDVGDLHWARAMVAFQRGLIDLFLVYMSDKIDLDQIKRGTNISIKVASRERAEAARQRFLEALDESDACRRAYLAETDDDREWVPNPKQKNHPMPLPVDDKLYQTWETVVGDARRMLKGEEGLELAGFWKFMGARDNEKAPPGYLNVGAWLQKVPDLELSDQLFNNVERNPEPLLRAMFGAGYVTTMKASPVFTHVARIRDEIKRGDESFERKLRYLFWIN